MRSILNPNIEDNAFSKMNILLYESEMTTKNIGRQYNITFEIERWGFN